MVMRRCVYEVVRRFELKLCDVCNCVLFFAGTGAISEADGVGAQQT